MICVDGTFLKTRYGGHMLCVVALDANSHIYPIAFVLVNSENHNSWNYFMMKLKEAIGVVDNLAFVSNRHASIIHALEVVFLDGHHEMWNASYEFQKSKFHRFFNNIKQMDPAIGQYLEGIGFNNGTRAYFPGNRYNIMTRNYTESFNNKTEDARTLLVTTFVEFIRFTLQSWFVGRRDEVVNCASTLSPLMEKDLAGIVADSKYLKVHALGQFEFHVVDPNGDGEGNLMTKSCSCGMFKIIEIPCVHAVAVAIDRGVNIYSLCSPFYTSEMWRESYKETIYPTSNTSGQFLRT
ncbi:uncharacterized protein LOC133799760 [Humulus lupulus]|uniref:uncharacterized protein LOC133799760 n=1 Tax=Humulus lupulus TaxID=3486 RepID=UPI002B4183EC|nr:uncharacterized protein LOC133799760 [Humulus lupulus]